MTESLTQSSEVKVDNDLLETLTPRQRQVYEMSKGLNGFPAMSYKAIARELALNPRTVGRTAERAMTKLGIVKVIDSSTEPESPDPRIINHPWFPKASGLSIEEIEVLEMSLEGFSDARIGREAGIGGVADTKAARKELARKFNLPLGQLMTHAPNILGMALASEPAIRGTNKIEP